MWTHIFYFHVFLAITFDDIKFDILTGLNICYLYEIEKKIKLN